VFTGILFFRVKTANTGTRIKYKPKYYCHFVPKAFVHLACNLKLLFNNHTHMKLLGLAPMLWTKHLNLSVGYYTNIPNMIPTANY
jgi:hypothetical protein